MRSCLRWWTASTLLASMLLHGCGGGGGGSAAAIGTAVDNVQAIAVGSGPTGQFPNMVTTSVTICVPGTTTCQTLADVQVDTGSSGLRLLASASASDLSPVTSAVTGGPYSECAGFAGGVLRGPLAKADVKLAGESAASISPQDIQVGPDMPTGRSAQAAPEDTRALLGVNGILGVGLFLQACGLYCASNDDAIYYVCATRTSCSEATLSVAMQVSNPAAYFARDNGGVILQLPAIPVNGAASADGNLIFGIGTQSNNDLAAVAIGVPDAGTTAGVVTTVYRGMTLANSFFDSGSTGLYFDGAGIRICSSTSPVGDLSSFCRSGPATALSAVPIGATLMGSDGVSVAVSANVGRAQFLSTQPGAANLNAFEDLAGPAGSVLPSGFDFGLPFFHGDAAYTAFEQHSTSGGAGPYFAFQSFP